MNRLDSAEAEIREWFYSIPRPRLVAFEDFAFAGRFSSYDIARHAERIRKIVWDDETATTLLIPPSSMKGWLAEEGMDVRVRDSKAPSIQWVTEVLKYQSLYRRKSDYNHTFDAAVLASMGRMAHQLFALGEAVGTERQRSIFLSKDLNKKGMPYGLCLRPELFYSRRGDLEFGS